MKKLLFVVVAMLVSITTLSAEERVIDKSQLPRGAQTFISTHYPNDKVSIATMERDLLNKDYKVILTNGVKVEFDSSGNWSSVETKKGSQVPEAIIPEYITSYVKSSFPSTRVVKIDRDKRFVEVDLNNDIELKFNTKGALVEFDS